MTPNEFDLNFLASNDCSKVSSNSIKIASVKDRHRQTDASDLIISPMLCNQIMSTAVRNNLHFVMYHYTVAGVDSP